MMLAECKQLSDFSVIRKSSLRANDAKKLGFVTNGPIKKVQLYHQFHVYNVPPASNFIKIENPTQLFS